MARQKKGRFQAIVIRRNFMSIRLGLRAERPPSNLRMGGKKDGCCFKENTT